VSGRVAGAPALDPGAVRSGVRKVRTGQGTVVGNANPARAEGKCHRKHTARVDPVERPTIRVRVKRCGKSAPRGR